MVTVGVITFLQIFRIQCSGMLKVNAVFATLTSNSNNNNKKKTARYRGADKSLARLGRKKATATKF